MSSQRRSVWPRRLVILSLLAAAAVLVALLQARNLRLGGTPKGPQLKTYPGAQVPPPPRHDKNRFVGSAVCAECHRQIAARYSAHPMAHSMIRVPEETPLEAFGRDTFF